MNHGHYYPLEDHRMYKRWGPSFRQASQVSLLDVRIEPPLRLVPYNSNGRTLKMNFKNGN